MSPLARIRQAAACTIIVFVGCWAVAGAGVAVAGDALLQAPPASVSLATAGDTQSQSQAPQLSGGTSALLAAATVGATAEPTSVPLAPAATPASAATPAPAATAAPVATTAPAASAPAKATVPPAAPAPAVTTSPPAPTGIAAPVATATAVDQAAPTTQPAKPVELAPNVPALIAHSALLSVEGTAKPDALQISIHRVGDKSLINTDDVTVAVDGKNQSVTRERGTVYELPINDLRGDGARDVDVTVAHDGIREIVSGKVTVTEAATASLLRDHKQVAWWALNIVIVLIAAWAFSGRKSKTEAEEAEEIE